MCYTNVNCTGIEFEMQNLHGRQCMAHCKTIILTSFKGGVGKSTITANLAMTLALAGKRVLAIDCDFNMRCLDLIMGMENRVIYDISDVILRSVAVERAILQDTRSPNLFFLAAPYSDPGTITADAFCRMVHKIGLSMGLDYILIDTPGDNGGPLRLAASAADRALVIATHQPASIRAAEKTAIQLHDLGVQHRRLIINNFDFSAVKRGQRPGIIDIIDRTCVQLIGVIPFDYRMMQLQENGDLVDSLHSCDTVTAFQNISKRIMHPNTQLPLFTGFRHGDRAVALK